LGEDVGIRKGRMIVHMVDVFLLLYKNRRMKPVQIFLRRGGRKMVDTKEIISTHRKISN
jgi:hypothetical protein